MTNEVIGWLVSIALVGASVCVRAIYLASRERLNTNR